MHPYRNFILMIAVSATLMFGLMYLNTHQLMDHRQAEG